MSRLIEADRTQQLLLPRAVEDWVGADHLARFISSFIAVLDLEELGIKTPRGERGEAPWGPKLMLGIWLYGWMTNVRSTRKLEKACRDSMAFIWLTGHQHPDHNAIWRFWKENHKALKKLFKKVVQVAADQQLIGLALHALDGTKMPAASSMETAWHRKTLEEMLKRLDEIIAAQVAQMEQQEKQEQGDFALPPQLHDEQSRRDAIVDALKKLDEADRSHVHPNETDARVMKGREGLLLGYNAQAVVDEKSDLVVAALVVNLETDAHQLVPMVLEAQANVGATAAATVADKGYSTGSQVAAAKSNNLPVIVAMPLDPDDGKFPKSEFTFDPQGDGYVCPVGEFLPFDGARKATGNTGYASRLYRCHNQTCPVRGECTDSKSGRIIKRSEYEEAMQENLSRTRLPENEFIQRRRAATVERLFGQTKGNDGFRRFTVRGLEKVNAQWMLKMTTHNLRKLYKMWCTGGFHIPGRDGLAAIG